MVVDPESVSVEHTEEKHLIVLTIFFYSLHCRLLVLGRTFHPGWSYCTVVHAVLWRWGEGWAVLYKLREDRARFPYLRSVVHCGRAPSVLVARTGTSWGASVCLNRHTAPLQLYQLWCQRFCAGPALCFLSVLLLFCVLCSSFHFLRK